MPHPVFLRKKQAFSRAGLRARRTGWRAGTPALLGFIQRRATKDRRRTQSTPFPVAVLILALPFILSACDPVTLTVVGAGGAVGMGTAEERGLEGAIDDTKIRGEINQLWANNDFAAFREVSLTVTEGRVLLTGSVEKPEVRVDAVRLAWQAAGVRQVIDEIQVTDQSGVISYLSDSWIAQKLRTELMFDGNVRNINYNVDVVNGIVYLMGIAQDQDELDRVIAYARDISGVKKVISHVLLKSDPRRNTGG